MLLAVMILMGGATLSDAYLPPKKRASIGQKVTDEQRPAPPAMPGLRTLCPAVPDAASATGEPLGLKIGRPLTPALRAQLGHDVTRVRILDGSAMATMDWVPERLTIVLDEDGRIKRLACG